MKISHIIVPAALIAALFFPPSGKYSSPGPGLAPIFASENAPTREILRLIHAVIDETDESKRQDLLGELRAYQADATALLWLKLLRDTAWVKKKVRIIDMMAEYGDRSFVLPLANLLISPQSAVRQSAARALKKGGDDRLYPVILSMVNSDVPVHKIYFIEAMNHLFDHRFYHSLTGLLRDENKSIRIYVINCLKENRILESLGLIRGSALNDRNDEVRVVAIEALGALRDGNSLGTLHLVLNDRNRDVRRESARSLQLIGSMMSVNALSSRLLNEDDGEIKEIMMDTLAALRRVGDVRGLERVLLSEKKADLRIKAAHVIGFSASGAALSALQRALPDPDFRVRAEACNSLGNYRNRQSLESLFDILGSGDRVYVRTAALHSIRRIKDKSSLMGLFDLFTVEKDPIVRELLKDAIREYIKRFV